MGLIVIGWKVASGPQKAVENLSGITIPCSESTFTEMKRFTLSPIIKTNVKKRRDTFVLSAGGPLILYNLKGTGTRD